MKMIIKIKETKDREGNISSSFKKIKSKESKNIQKKTRKKRPKVSRQFLQTQFAPIQLRQNDTKETQQN